MKIRPNFLIGLLLVMAFKQGPFANISCLEPNIFPDDFLPTRPEDKGIVGYHVRSYFNKPINTEWNRVYGSGLLESDSAHYLMAPKALRVIGDNYSTTYLEKALEPPENVCSDANLSLKFWAPNMANLASVQVFGIQLISGIRLEDNAIYTIHHQVRNPQLFDTGHWSRVNLAVRVFNSTPGFDCHSVSRIRIGLSAKPGLNDTLIFGELGFYPSPLPPAVLFITEDDQWANFDTNGVPAMRRYGFSGNIYVNGSSVGAVNKMGMARLKVLQDSGGWTIGSHLWTHDSITSLTNDSADRSMKRNAGFLQCNGFTGFRHFAYPYGKSDLAKDSIVKLNAQTARLVVGWPEGEALPFSDPYRLRVLGFLQNGVTLDMAKSVILNLVNNRMASIIGVHEIVASGLLDSNKWYRADWEELLAYVDTFVQQGRLKVYSIEAFQKISNY